MTEERFAQLYTIYKLWRDKVNDNSVEAKLRMVGVTDDELSEFKEKLGGDLSNLIHGLEKELERDLIERN